MVTLFTITLAPLSTPPLPRPPARLPSQEKTQERPKKAPGSALKEQAWNRRKLG